MRMFVFIINDDGFVFVGEPIGVGVGGVRFIREARNLSATFCKARKIAIQCSFRNSTFFCDLSDCLIRSNRIKVRKPS